MEGTLGAFFHASTTHLERLNAIQQSFVHRLNLTETEAFGRFNLAPLQLRRDISALGILHKATLNILPYSLQTMFPPAVRRVHHPTRINAKRHRSQLMDRCDGGHSALLQSSIFGMVKVYNLLDQETINATTISLFQRRLTEKARLQSRTDNEFAYIFCNRR